MSFVLGVGSVFPLGFFPGSIHPSLQPYLGWIPGIQGEDGGWDGKRFSFEITLSEDRVNWDEFSPELQNQCGCDLGGLLKARKTLFFGFPLMGHLV